MFVLGVIAVAAVLPALGWLLGRRSAPLHDAIVVGWNRAVCRILNLELKVHGALDPDARLLVANHVSWLDIIALGSQFPCLFVAKEEVARWPVVGFLAKGINTLFVRRGDNRQTGSAAQMMVWRLRQGRRVLLFPEGTTTAGDRVLRFHGKLFQPAELAGVSAQAIALRYSGAARNSVPFVGEDEFLPHLLGVIRLERIDLDLHYCPALPAGMNRNETTAAAHAQISAIVDPGWAEARARGRSART